jgi:phospholipase/carboxylesterase
VSEGPTGLHELALGGEVIGQLYVPPANRAAQLAPVAVMLHGAGGNAEQGLGLLFELADEHGLILLALDSVSSTWDVLRGGFGPDIIRLDRALGELFQRYAVDRGRLAIGGFSDGASYALSVGLTNGDLFTHVIAFSPGFASPSATHGLPQIFVSHGTQDTVLPIDRTSRSLVPRLRRAGYAVEYLEFTGPHAVPPAVTLAAMSWFVPKRMAQA